MEHANSTIGVVSRAEDGQLEIVGDFHLSEDYFQKIQLLFDKYGKLSYNQGLQFNHIELLKLSF